MGCGVSLDAASLAVGPPPDSAEGAGRPGHTGTARAVPGDDAAGPPPGTTAVTVTPAAKLPLSPNDWLQGVAAREQRQAAWAKDETPHWETARMAAVAAAAVTPAAGATVAETPLLLLNVAGAAAGAAPAVPDSEELAALMCGRLDLPAMQRLTRPPGLAVFCSSTVRRLRGEGSPPSPLPPWRAVLGTQY